VYADILKPVVTPLKALVEGKKKNKQTPELKRAVEIKEEKGKEREQENRMLKEVRELYPRRAWIRFGVFEILAGNSCRVIRHLFKRMEISSCWLEICIFRLQASLNSY